LVAIHPSTFHTPRGHGSIIEKDSQKKYLDLRCCTCYIESFTYRILDAFLGQKLLSLLVVPFFDNLSANLQAEVNIFIGIKGSLGLR